MLLVMLAWSCHSSAQLCHATIRGFSSPWSRCHHWCHHPPRSRQNIVHTGNNICINNSFSTDCWHSRYCGTARQASCLQITAITTVSQSKKWLRLSRLGSTSSESIMLSKLLMFFTLLDWSYELYLGSLHTSTISHYMDIIISFWPNFQKIESHCYFQSQHDLKALKSHKAGTGLQICIILEKGEREGSLWLLPWLTLE